MFSAQVRAGPPNQFSTPRPLISKDGLPDRRLVFVLRASWKSRVARTVEPWARVGRRVKDCFRPRGGASDFPHLPPRSKPPKVRDWKLSRVLVNDPEKRQQQQQREKTVNAQLALPFPDYAGQLFVRMFEPFFRRSKLVIVFHVRTLPPVQPSGKKACLIDEFTQP